MTTAYIALGSNVGDRIANLAHALQAIAHIPDTHVNRASSAYESEPAYHTDQEPFANGVVEIETDLDSDQLLGYLQGIEDEMGRVRDIENGPRVIDLDILTFGAEETSSEALTIPHPRLLERDFVVTPLLEIAPRLHLPDGTRVKREDATVGPIVRDLGAIPDLGRLSNEPVLAADWVVVAENTREMDLLAGWDAGLQFQREALEEAGIPFAWDPFEPEATMDPFGMPATFRLLVPASDADHAKKLLADLDSAEMIFPPGVLGEVEG